MSQQINLFNPQFLQQKTNFHGDHDPSTRVAGARHGGVLRLCVLAGPEPGAPGRGFGARLRGGRVPQTVGRRKRNPMHPVADSGVAEVLAKLVGRHRDEEHAVGVDIDVDRGVGLLGIPGPAADQRARDLIDKAAVRRRRHPRGDAAQPLTRVGDKDLRAGGAVNRFLLRFSFFTWRHISGQARKIGHRHAR